METFGDVLRRIRGDRGLSMRALGALVHYSASYIHALEHGHRPPSREIARRLDDALAAGGELVAALPSLPEPDVDVDRVAHVAARPSHVDAGAVEALASMLAAHRRLEDSVGAAPVIAPVAANLRLVERLARDARGDLHDTVVGLLSELAQYAGWLRMPLEQWGEAERLLDRAIVAAIEAGDRARTSNALSFAAHRYLISDKTRAPYLRRAGSLNDGALRYGKDLPGLGVQLMYQQAEIHARTGDRSAAVATLVEADRMVEQLPPPEDLPSSGYWYTPAFFQGSKAIVLDYMGDHETASREMRASLAAMPEDWRDSEWAEYRRSIAER